MSSSSSSSRAEELAGGVFGRSVGRVTLGV